MLSTNLKYYSKQCHLTQKELAEKVGIAEITIRKYEKGDREPNLETIHKLASALSISPYELLTVEDTKSIFERNAVNVAATNLSLLFDSPDKAINDLAISLECLVENVAANTFNKHNIPKHRYDNREYIYEMNRLLNKIAMIVNPVGRINNQQYLDFVKSIDDFLDYRLTKYNYEED